MKMPSIMSIVTWLFRNWNKIYPVAKMTWELIPKQDAKDIPGTDKEENVITELQNAFPYLATSIAKLLVNLLVLFRRAKKNPAETENKIEDAALQVPKVS